MEKPGLLNFKVGQLAEMRTFEEGYRGAWFRCKIKDIRLETKEIFVEYPDFDGEEPGWVNIYQMPPYGRKSKLVQKQLMVRPQYPAVYRSESDMPPLNSITQEAGCVVVHDGTWKVGNYVDWNADDSYWSAMIVNIMSDNKAKIELPMPPLGQGKGGEEGLYKASFKDLRPCLDWSETKGWSLPAVDAPLTSCDAHLIFSTKQVEQNGTDLEDQHAAEVEAEAAAEAEAAGSPVNASFSTHMPVERAEDRISEQNVKKDGDCMESSESSSSLHVKKRRASNEEVEVEAEAEKRELNIMHEHTLEAAMLDLGELFNKVNWMQSILQSPDSDVSTSLTSWKFA